MTTFYMCCSDETDDQQQQQQRTDEDVDDSEAASTHSNEQRVGTDDGLSYMLNPVYAADIDKSSQITSDSGKGRAKVTTNEEDVSVYSDIYNTNSHREAPSDGWHANIMY